MTYEERIPIDESGNLIEKEEIKQYVQASSKSYDAPRYHISFGRLRQMVTNVDCENDKCSILASPSGLKPSTGFPFFVGLPISNEY